MANHKSALKRARQNAVRNARNRSSRTRVKSLVKQAQEAIASGDKAKAVEAAQAAERALKRAGRKNALHRRNAARRTSRLARRAAAL